MKEQLAAQTEQLALQRGSIREIIASITTTANTSFPAGGALARTNDPSELVALEGIWEDAESGSTACMRFMNGELRCPYVYGPGATLTGEYHSFRAINGALFGRFRWSDGAFSGYFYLRIESPDRLVGGWWFAEAVPAAAVERLPHVEGMVESTWIRRPRTTSYPAWADQFFESLGRAAQK